MAKKEAKKANKKKDNNEFIEFEYEGNEFSYTGRIYPGRAREAGKCTITPMSLTINNLITIKGCKLFQTDKNTWIQGPQYNVDDEYKDYLYIAKELNEELDDLCEAIEDKLP